LQKVIRQDIKDSFDDYDSPVQYGDIMWRRLKSHLCLFKT